LNNYSLTPGDVISAISAQNVQISSDEVVGLPSLSKQQLDATVIGPSRLQTPEQFSNILLKVNPDGSQVHLHKQERTRHGDIVARALRAVSPADRRAVCIA
jgi:multidrug efflux pump